MNLIRQKRVAKGLSQIQLAILCCLPNSAISDFELNKRIAWPGAKRKIAQALGCKEEEVFPREGGEDGKQ